MPRVMPFVPFVCFVVASLEAPDNPLPGYGFDITFQYEIP